MTTALRVLMEGYSGWDPPEDPDPPNPYPLWDETVKLYPDGLQRLLDKKPKKGTDQVRFEESVSLFSEIELSDESGLSLTVTAIQGTDADEDGAYGYAKEKIEYGFYQGRQHWDGDEESGLKKDLREFLKQLEANDPEGYEKAK